MDRQFLEGLNLEPSVIDEILREHDRALEGQRFESQMGDAIRAAGGRNQKAIRALLDEKAIGESEDRQAALEQALRQVKQDSPYLFDTPVRPMYAGGVPAQVRSGCTMEDLGAMSMAEYRRFRKGV